VKHLEDGQIPDPNWLLFNGQTAGQFALKFVVGNYKKRKRKEIKHVEDQQQVEDQEEEEETCVYQDHEGPGPADNVSTTILDPPETAPNSPVTNIVENVDCKPTRRKENLRKPRKDTKK